MSAAIFTRNARTSAVVAIPPRNYISQSVIDSAGERLVPSKHLGQPES